MVARKDGPEPVAWVKTAEAADILHVSPKTVSRWAKEGRIACSSAPSAATAATWNPTSAPCSPI